MCAQVQNSHTVLITDTPAPGIREVLIKTWGTQVAQLVGHLALGFGSYHEISGTWDRAPYGAPRTAEGLLVSPSFPARALSFQ